MILAIIQSIPNHPPKVVRTDTFAKFQHVCGMIEQQSYLAAHAACHATMNGFTTTIVADADIQNDASLQSALEFIFNAGPFDALVIPGLTDATKQKHVCDICTAHLTDFQFKLFLDPERSDSTQNIIIKQQTLPRFASYAWPWVATLTPGRRSSEVLPPSTLIPALALHITDKLRGVHELDSISASDSEILNDNGVLVLVKKTMDRRPVISIKSAYVAAPKQQLNPNSFVDVTPPSKVQNDDPIQAQIDQKEAAIEAMLLDQVNARCDSILKQNPLNNERLWKSLERTATAVLMDAKMRGLIKTYHVRCDEETASWGTPTTPVVEILITFAKRVKQLKLVSRKD